MIIIMILTNNSSVPLNVYLNWFLP